MTPLFALPGGAEADVIPGTGRRVRPAGRTRRPSSRLPAGRSDREGEARGGAARGAGTGKSGPLKEPADLLAVTAERLRRALARSFLRYGIAGDLEAVVHAAMNVVEPVLEARDTEILRLRRLRAAQVPARVSAQGTARVPARAAAKGPAKVPAKAPAGVSAKVSGKVSG
ncbi:MAG: hypothetical protein M3Z75_19920 [Actinomycetota bacterium]|nr:hypothetical protein [Actinomycetota bacterium]